MGLDSLRNREAFSPSGAAASEYTEQVVRGLVHQMNNLLTVFHGYSSMLVSNEALDSDTRECVQEIKTAADRASDLLARVGTVARKSSVHATEVNLHDFIEVQCRSVKTLVAAPAVLVVAIDKEHTVTADPSTLKQALTAVVTNAVQALDGEGTVRLESTADKDTVSLLVIDDGRGIPEDVLEKIFIPFFSQRKDLGCIGLGLAAARHGMTALGGTISVASEPGEGTCVRLTLPRASC